MEDRKFSINIENLIIGVTIGFFLGYAIAKKIITQSLQENRQTSLSLLNIGIQQLSKRLEAIEKGLNVPDDIYTPSPTPFSDQKMLQVQENDEDFELKTDARGRMIGFKTHRKLYSSE